MLSCTTSGWSRAICMFYLKYTDNILVFLLQNTNTMLELMLQHNEIALLFLASDPTLKYKIQYL